MGFDSKVVSGVIRRVDHKLYLAILIFITILAAFFRIYNLGLNSLWLDEATSILISRGSISSIIQADVVHPPLYYLMLHVFIFLGDSEWIVRVPSAIFGIAAIPLIFKLGDKLYGRKQGLIAAFLLAISYVHIYYSKDARMYTMLFFFTLLSIYLFWVALEKNDRRSWMLLTVINILGLYTHYMMIPILLVEFLFVLFTHFHLNLEQRGCTIKRDTLKPYILSLILTALAIAPIALMALSGLSGKMSGRNIIGIRPNYAFFHDVVIWFDPTSELGRSTEPIFSLLYIILFGYGIFRSVGKKEKETFLMILYFFIPIIFSIWVASEMHFMPRYVLHILPAFLIVISYGIVDLGASIAKVGGKLSRVPYIELIVTIIIVGSVATITFPHIKNISTEATKNDWRAAADYLKMNAVAGDVIIIEPGYNRNPLLYYYNSTSCGTILLYPNGNITMIEEIVEGYDDVWFVVTRDIAYIEDGDAALSWIQGHTALKDQFKGVAIAKG